MNGLWQRAADRLRDELGQVGYETWIQPLNFVGMQGRTATIEAPNRFFRDWINQRYAAMLRQSLSSEAGEPVEVRLTLGKNGNGHGHGFTAPPDLETRIAIVQKKSALENLRLQPDVALYVAQSVPSNVRELEGSLTRLAALASLNKSAITVEFARQALHDLIANHDAKPDVEMIQKTVADFFHVPLADLKSKKRTQHIAFCRQVAMYLCRKLTDSSFPTIGDHFGRDHSTGRTRMAGVRRAFSGSDIDILTNRRSCPAVGCGGGNAWYRIMRYVAQ